jgi:hypothetical protein
MLGAMRPSARSVPPPKSVWKGSEIPESPAPLPTPKNLEGAEHAATAVLGVEGGRGQDRRRRLLVLGVEPEEGAARQHAAPADLRITERDGRDEELDAFLQILIRPPHVDLRGFVVEHVHVEVRAVEPDRLLVSRRLPVR